MGRADGELLERTEEVTAVGEALAQVKTGEGALLLFDGPAGIGKTRLLEEARSRAAALDFAVLGARPSPLDADIPWNVVRQLLLTALAVDEREADQLLSGAAGLARPALGLGTGHQIDADAFAPLHGLYWLVANLARERPLLLVVDDLQWTDTPSARFLAHLASRIEGLPIMVLGALRRGEPAPTAGPLLTLSGLAEAQVLHPAPLSIQASTALITQHLGRSVDDEVARACHRMTGGNPFLLGELTRGLAELPGPLTPESVSSIEPGSLARTLLSLLTRMGPSALAFARAVAVLGGGAGLTVAAQIGDQELGAATEAADRLVRAGVLEARGNELEFAHPLVQEAIYGELSPPARWRMHSAAARALAQSQGHEREVAAHLLATTPAADDWTVDRLCGAARSAQAEGAAELAASYLTRALAEPPASERRVEVLVDLGRLETEYAPASAAERLAEAATLVDGAARRVEIASLRARALSATGQYEAAARVINQAAGHAEALDPPERAEFEATRFAICRWDRASLATADELFAEMRARASRGETLSPRESANLGNELAARGEDRELAIEHIRRALAASYLPYMSQSVPILAISLIYAGQAAEADAAISRALAEAQRRGSRLDSASATSAAAYAALSRGDLSDAVALGTDALELSDGGPLTPLIVLTVTEAQIERGATDQAWQTLGDHGLSGTLGSSWPEAFLRSRRGPLFAACNQHQDALDDLFEVGRALELWRAPNPAQVPWRSSAVPSLLALNRVDEARQLAAEELSLAQRWGAPRALGIAQGALGLCDSSPAGLALLRAAVATLEQAPARLELARAQCALGARLRRERQPSEAREPLRAALDLAHRCGALAVAQRARDELVAVGLRPRRPALSGREALTPRELRVAELAAQGMTNREIAQALFITSRTVEHHLSSAYSKLGIRARRQLAAALTGTPQPVSARATDRGPARPAARPSSGPWPGPSPSELDPL